MHYPITTALPHNPFLCIIALIYVRALATTIHNYWNQLGSRYRG